VPTSSGKDVDDAAFDHICSKLASRFIPYITSYGILKYAIPSTSLLTLVCVMQVNLLKPGN
jgi:hypothetical protein